MRTTSNYCEIITCKGQKTLSPNWFKDMSIWFIRQHFGTSAMLPMLKKLRR